MIGLGSDKNCCKAIAKLSTSQITIIIIYLISIRNWSETISQNVTYLQIDDHGRMLIKLDVVIFCLAHNWSFSGPADLWAVFLSKHCKNESHVLAICFMQTSWSSSTSPLCQNIMIPTSCPSLALLGPPRDWPSWASWTSTLLAPWQKWQGQMGLFLAKKVIPKVIILIIKLLIMF